MKSQTLEIEDQDIDTGFFAADLRCLASHYIQVFLSAKEISISESLLAEYLSLVMNLDVCAGVDMIYDMVDDECISKEVCSHDRGGRLPDDVKCVIGLYNKCARLGIPKAFATGIILMYLDICYTR